jgi:hypothetical protein
MNRKARMKLDRSVLFVVAALASLGFGYGQVNAEPKSIAFSDLPDPSAQEFKDPFRDLN